MLKFQLPRQTLMRRCAFKHPAIAGQPPRQAFINARKPGLHAQKPPNRMDSNWFFAANAKTSRRFDKSKLTRLTSRRRAPAVPQQRPASTRQVLMDDGTAWPSRHPWPGTRCVQRQGGENVVPGHTRKLHAAQHAPMHRAGVPIFKTLAAPNHRYWLARRRFLKP